MYLTLCRQGSSWCHWSPKQRTPHRDGTLQHSATCLLGFVAFQTAESPTPRKCKLSGDRSKTRPSSFCALFIMKLTCNYQTLWQTCPVFQVPALHRATSAAHDQNFFLLVKHQALDLISIVHSQSQSHAHVAEKERRKAPLTT